MNNLSLRDILGDGYEFFIDRMRRYREKNYLKIGNFFSEKIKIGLRNSPEALNEIKIRGRKLGLNNEKKIFSIKKHNRLIKRLCETPNLIESGFTVIGTNFGLGKYVFDILGIDKNGILTIVEVKVDKHKGRLQVYKYADTLRKFIKLFTSKKIPIKLILIRETESGLKKDVWMI